MANLINEAEIRNTWAPIIEEATGITESNKLAWMSEYCHNHKLYEDANIMALNPGMNLAGMGAVSFPANGSTANVGGSGANGSGDKAPTLLPLAMQVAAQTIGLDLVPVVPMAGPMGLLSYLDYTYEGGVADAITNGADGTVAPTYVKAAGAGTADIAAVGGTNGDYEFVGTSRIDGKSIFKVGTLDGANATVAADLEAAGADAGSVELVKAMEDHIPGFTGDADADGNALPFSREKGESTRDKLMGLSLFSKSVAAETFQVAAGETRGEAHRRILTNVLAAANFIANKGRRGAGNFAVVDAKIASALQGIAGFVPNPMANTFNQVAGAIYPVGSVAGINVYTDPRLPFNGGYLGDSAGTHRILVGRKGDGNSAGLVFMPYLMAESVQTIAEGTMAPKVAVKSRFALVEAGFHPETQYVEFKVNNVEL